MSSALRQESDIDLFLISKTLNRLAGQVHRVAEVSDHLGTGAPQPDRSTSALNTAEWMIRLRSVVARAAGEDATLFGDPALDVLITLYTGAAHKAHVSVTSACYAASSPMTTTLRYIAKLEAAGYIVRENDPFDRRRQFLSLSLKGNRFVETCLSPGEANAIERVPRSN